MWMLEYLGKEWESGKSGPDSFDCWGLVRHIQQHIYGIFVPEIVVDADDISAVVKNFKFHNERNHWSEIILPQDGDCVLMSQNKEPTHIGVWIEVDGGKIIHAVKGAGVVISSRVNLKMMGYNILGIYRCLPQ